MRIEEELKLDYSDVLFRPKRSTLSSRKDVDLNRTYKFKYSRNEWAGIPIMAANMDGVGELGIADALSANEMITCLTKQHDVKKLSKYKNLKKNYKNIALSIGIKKEDFDNLDKILKAKIGNGIGKIGEVLSDSLEIACGNNQSIIILEIQRQGKSPQKIVNFMLGSKIKKGSMIYNV